MIRNLMFADCETNPFKRGANYQPLIFGVLRKDGDFKEYRTFEKVEKFIEYCAQFSGICYFHNGGKFDFLFMLKYIEGEVLYINGRLSSFKIGECEFRDSFLILPCALAEYKKDDFNYDLLNDYKKNKKAIKEYLKNDCIFLSEIVLEFIETYGTKISLASSALQFFKKLYGLKNKEFKTKSIAYDTLFRKYYFGGRVDFKKTGIYTGDFKYFDINSAYPFAMLHDMPWGYKFKVSEKSSDIKPHSFVNLKCKENGIFPVFGKDGVIAFPKSEKIREFFITGHEYLIAKKYNLLSGVKIIEVTTHEKTINFSKYILHFYELKKGSKKGQPAYIFAKLFLNTLYGKFGQNWQEFNNHAILKGGKIEVEIKGKKYLYSGELDGKKCLYTSPVKDGWFFNVAISASITGFVRAHLFDAIAKSKGFLYCDTDSIFCEDFAGNVSDKLGDWHLEGEYNKLIIAGKKLYYAYGKKGHKDVMASKGVKISQKEFEKIAKGETVIYDRENPSINMKTGEISYISRAVKMQGKTATKKGETLKLKNSKK